MLHDFSRNDMIAVGTLHGTHGLILAFEWHRQVRTGMPASYKSCLKG